MPNLLGPLVNREFLSAQEEGHMRKSPPLGELDLLCPSCKTKHTMIAWEWTKGIFDGALSRKQVLHLYCPAARRVWTADEKDRAKLEAQFRPVSEMPTF